MIDNPNLFYVYTNKYLFADSSVSLARIPCQHFTHIHHTQPNLFRTNAVRRQIFTVCARRPFNTYMSRKIDIYRFHGSLKTPIYNFNVLGYMLLVKIIDCGAAQLKEWSSVWYRLLKGTKLDSLDIIQWSFNHICSSLSEKNPYLPLLTWYQVQT